MSQETERAPSKVLKKMTLINVVAAMFTSIFLIDSIIPAASAGSSTIIWYLILGVAFYIPYGFITAEFSSKIPDEGGVYAWVKTTLGIGSAKRVAWYYWVNVGIWAPSIAVYIAQLIQFMWYTSTPSADSMYNFPWETAGIAIAFMWASLLFAYFPIADNQHLFTSATIGKIVIVLFLFIGMFTYIGQGKASATDFKKIPDEFSDVGSLIMFLPALVYNVLGLEAIAGEASNIRNPKKTMAKAAIITTLALMVFYIATTFAVQYIFNTADGLDLSGIIQGLIDAFGFGEIGSKIVINLLAITFIWTMFVETMGWVSGANAGIAESAENKEVQGIFKWRNSRGMPFKSTILLGTIGTAELLLFTGLGYAQDGTIGGDLFWSLFAASSNILFLSYFIMFVAYIRAKWTGQLEKYDGFSINKVLGIIMASTALVVLAVTWFLLLWSPDYDVVNQTVPIIASVAVALIAGEVCFLFANKKFRGGWLKNHGKQKVSAAEVSKKETNPEFKKTN